ncbi:MAG: ABC transporter permease [Ilumatobacteraceae bacterium]
MFLALKEMRRAKVRFGLLMAAVGLLVFLVLFQQSLQNGLLTAFTGGIEHQSAPVVVYSVDGRRNLQGGVIVPELEQLVRTTDGVGEVGRFSLATFTVADGEATDASVVGFEGLGAPDTLVAGRLPRAPGEAVADVSDADRGFDIGDTVKLDPAGFEITVVGLAEDVLINVTPTLWVPYETYEAAVNSRAQAPGTILPGALVVAPANGVTPAQLVERINAASNDLDALTRADAADLAPGVSQVRTSFRIIFLLYALVIPLVTGLFF